MRSQNLRSVARLGTMLAALGGITLAASPAHANDVQTGSSGGTNTSIGSAALKFEQTKGIPTSITTGFHGPDFAKIQVGIDLDPVANGGPLYSIDMPKGAQLQANWGTDKKIVLKAVNGSQTDGLVNVRHTLTPSVDFKFSGFGLNAAFSYNADSLINKIPGSRWDFDSKASQQFAPWGFAGIDTKLNAPDVAGSTLFSMGMDALPDFVSNNVTGSFGVRATTKPTFTYKTTKISFAGAAGSITGAGAELTVPAADGDYMEVMTAVEGSMDVKGALSIQPFVHIDTILDQFNINSDFGIDVMSFDYTVPSQKVNFQTALVHIPMPNVHAPSRGVDVGDVKAGASQTKTISIENTGEKEALMSFKSSDGQFSVPNGTVTVPAKSKYDLKVTFSPSGDGAASADITITSSDADSPIQSFKIGANGADVGADPSEDGDLPGKGKADSGCGCKTAGTSSTPSWAGLGLAGLGALVFFRRRRNAA